MSTVGEPPFRHVLAPSSSKRALPATGLGRRGACGHTDAGAPGTTRLLPRIVTIRGGALMPLFAHGGIELLESGDDHESHVASD